jgi:hypothetical protein
VGASGAGRTCWTHDPIGSAAAKTTGTVQRQATDRDMRPT